MSNKGRRKETVTKFFQSLVIFIVLRYNGLRAKSKGWPGGGNLVIRAV